MLQNRYFQENNYAGYYFPGVFIWKNLDIFFQLCLNTFHQKDVTFSFMGGEVYWETSDQSAKIANILHKSKQGIATEMQSSYQQTVLCFSYLRKSRGETGLVLHCFDFPYFSPLLFVFIVDLGVVLVWFFFYSII